MSKITFKDSGGSVTKTVWYDYDVFDRRISKKVDDTGNGTADRSEYYVHEDSPTSNLDGVALVLDDNGDVTNRYLHGPDVDQVFADENALGEILWNLTDHQGTVRDIVDYDEPTDTTEVVKHIKYGVFGNIDSVEDGSGTVLPNGADDLRHAYTGREWDADADLYYYRARWYDADLARFISEDPMGFDAGDANLNRYVGNNSLNAVDPSGLKQVSDTDLNTYRDPGTGKIVTQPTYVQIPPGKPKLFNSYIDGGNYYYTTGKYIIRSPRDLKNNEVLAAIAIHELRQALPDAIVAAGNEARAARYRAANQKGRNWPERMLRAQMRLADDTLLCRKHPGRMSSVPLQVGL